MIDPKRSPKPFKVITSGGIKFEFASWSHDGQPEERCAAEAEFTFQEFGHGEDCDCCRIGFGATPSEMREIARQIMAAFPEPKEAAR